MWRETLSAVAFLCSLAAAHAADRIAVNAFPNAKALVLWAGAEHGIFAAAGLDVAVELTESSQAQRAGLAAGEFQLAHSALDNAIAMIVDGKDVVIVAGGDSGMNELMVQADVRDWADIKGRWLAVDAPDTAYALQARKILGLHGLKAGTDYEVKAVGSVPRRYRAMIEDKRYAISILNLPFNVEGAANGLVSRGRLIDLLGPYQAAGVFGMRGWAEANGALLERYLRAYVTAQRWALEPKNRAASLAMLEAHLKLSPQIAARTLDQLADPGFGYTRDARFDAAGFANTLALRAEVEGGQDASRAKIERAVDLGWYARAMKGP